MKKLFTRRGKDKGKAPSGFVISGPPAGASAQSGATLRGAAGAGGGDSDMPDQGVVEAQFEVLVMRDLELPPEAARSMTLEQKWQLVLEKQRHTQGRSERAYDLIQMLEKRKTSPQLAEINKLQVLTQSKPATWLKEFAANDGHTKMFTVLAHLISKPHKNNADTEMIADLARSIKNLMNVKECLDSVLTCDVSASFPGGNGHAMCILTRTLDYVNVVTKALIIKILAAITLLDSSGHQLVRTALEQTDEFRLTYMCKLVTYLHNDNIELVLATMYLLNAVLSQAEDASPLLTILKKSSLSDALSELTKWNSDAINTQLDLFREVAPDVKIEKRAPAVPSKSSAVRSAYRKSRRTMAVRNASHVFTSLQQQLQNTPCNVAFVSMLEKMLLIPKDGDAGFETWLAIQTFVTKLAASNISEGTATAAIKRALQATVTSVEQGGDPDASPDANVPSNLTQGEVDKLYAQIDELTRQVDELKAGGAVPADGDAPVPPMPVDGAPVPPMPVDGVPVPPMPEGGGPPPPPPPPPGAGGAAPPPPPPPPGGPGSAPTHGLPPKKVYKPSVKMRALPWTPLKPFKIKGTFWERAQDDYVLRKLNFPQIEELFGKGVTMQPKKRVVKKKQEPKEITLLDAKRRNNVAIMLTRFKMPFSAIRKAIITVDDEVLTLENLMLMKPFLPQPDEIALLQAFDGNKALLGKAERFFLEVMEVPALTARFQALVYKGQYPDRFQMLDLAVKSVLQACKALRSKSFAKVLEIVLGIGNYMNGSTFRGEAYGFKLNVLGQLTGVRGNDDETSLMQYIVEVIESRFSDVLNWTDTMSAVAEAAQVSSKQAIIDVQQLTTGLAQVQTMANSKPCGSGDCLASRLKPFLAVCEPQVKGIAAECKTMQEEMQDIAAFFGEDPKATDAEEFFGMIHRFVEGFKMTQSMLARRRAAAAKPKRTVGFAAGKGDAAGRKPPAGAVKVGGDRGELDAMFSRLRDGSAFKRG